MKPFLFLILLTVTFSPAHSQRLYEMNMNAYSFGQNVNVRSEPEAHAEVLHQLIAGEKITILDVTPVSYRVNGLENPWLRVRTTTGAIGYVWGGLVARASSRVTMMGLGEGFLMYGLLGRDENGPQWALRFCNSFGAFREFKVPGPENDLGLVNSNSGYFSTYLISLTVKNWEGFDPPFNLIELHFQDSEGADGGTMAWYHFTWNGSELAHWFEYTANWGMYVDSKYFSMVFPVNEGGSPNQVKVNWAESKWSPEPNSEGEPEETVTDLGTEVYEWNGTRLLRRD